MRKIILIFFFISICSLFFSQKNNYTRPGAVKEFLIPAESKIIGHFDLFYESYVPNSNGEKRSFWYKIVFTKDCYFELNLFPINEADRYDFNLFKISDDANFCESLQNKKVFFLTDTKVTKTWNDNEQTWAFRQNLVYSKKIAVKKNDAIYLEINNLWGADLGHIIEFTTCDYTYVLKALKQNSLPNLVEVSAKNKLQNQKMEQNLLESVTRIEKMMCPNNNTSIKLASISFNNNGAILRNTFAYNGNMLNTMPDSFAIAKLKLEKQLKDSTVKITSIKAKIDSVVINKMQIECAVLDAKTLKNINAKITIKKELNGVTAPVKSRPNEVGKYLVEIESNTHYLVECTIIGYKTYTSTIDISKYAQNGKFEIKLQALQEGNTFTLKNVYFHPNTAIVRVESKKELENLFAFLQQNNTTEIEISGHTNGNNYIDPEKNRANLSKEWNFKGTSKKLSLLRAEKIKEFLVKNGIDEKRIKVKGYGGDKPIFPEAKSLEEIEKNIRVEVLLLKT